MKQMAQAPQSSRTDAPAPVRPVKLEKPEIDIERRPDGTMLIRSRFPLDDYPPRITDRLVHWAKQTPDRTFMAARDANGEWRHITYAQALQYAKCIGQALLSRKLSAERPVAILSGNDLEHAMLALGCLYVGIPYAPISPAYSLVSSDFGKLRYILDLLTPGMVFASDGQQYAKAIQAIIPEDVELVFTRNPMPGRKSIAFDHLAATTPTDAVEDAHDKVGPDTIAKFLFTSGSTGMPKGVINTQRMWCSNQIMVRSALQYLQDEPPTILDWAPWHHTAGGNHDVGLVLYNGGTFYIDEGKPLPGAIEATVRNLKDVAPTWYFNVPRGYDALLPFFRADEQLRRNFFSRLKVLWFAGAAIAQHTYDEYQQLALQTIGQRILFLTGLGSTETAPFAMSRMWESSVGVNMGLPARGSTLKLVPVDGKLEARFKGPHITPGYWRQPDLTAKAFDEEGFYKIGDALKFEDENGGLQTRHRHLGQCRPAAGGVHLAFRTLCARCRVRRCRPRLYRGAGGAGGGEPARGGGRPAEIGFAGRGTGPSGGEGEVQGIADELREGLDRQLQPHPARGAACRAAVARCRRNHRQGLDQPARGAEPS
jgi:feruloyl-CoA synthase